MYDGYLEQLPVELVGEGRATLVSWQYSGKGVGEQVKHIVLCRAPFRYLDRYQRAADEGGKAQVMKRPNF